MQVTIRFDRALGRKNYEFFHVMHDLALRYSPKPYLIGLDMGFNVSNLSWNDCYKLAGEFIAEIRDKGVAIIDGIKIIIQSDHEVSGRFPMPFE
jgi:hypothetical protein